MHFANKSWQKYAFFMRGRLLVGAASFRR